jgi:hypothetical protein
MRQYFKLLFILCIVACGSHTKLTEAGGVVAKLFNAVEYSVTENYSTGTSGNNKIFVFEIKNPQMNEGTEKSDVTSIAALSLFRELGDASWNYDQIKVQVINDSTFSESYEVQRLSFINNYLGKMDKFFALVKADDSTRICQFLKNKYFTDSICAVGYSYIKNAGKDHGRIKNVIYTGFEYGVTETSKFPCVVLKAELTCTHKYLHYEFTIVENTGEITYLTISE